MKIKLLKDHHFYGNAGTEVDLPEGAANYLVRMGVALYSWEGGVFTEWTKEEFDLKTGIFVLSDNEEDDTIREHELEKDVSDFFDKLEKEKKEFKPEPEKKIHTGLPVGTKKRGRKPKSG